MEILLEDHFSQFNPIQFVAVPYGSHSSCMLGGVKYKPDEFYLKAETLTCEEGTEIILSNLYKILRDLKDKGAKAFYITYREPFVSHKSNSGLNKDIPFFSWAIISVTFKDKNDRVEALKNNRINGEL